MSAAIRNLPSLTSGRGLAAMWVVLHHACLVWGGVLLALGDVGWIGVSFFYILSGFVLTWSYHPKSTVRDFYVHRLARIYPVHLVTLALSIAGYWIFLRPFDGFVASPVGTLANLLLVQDWFVGHPAARQGWNGVSWSLSAEFFFYLFAPVLIPALQTASKKILLDVCISMYLVHLTIAACVAHLGLAALEDFMIFHPVARIPEFIYGIAGAVFFQRGFRLNLSLPVRISTLLPLALYCWITPTSRSALLMIDLAVPAFITLILCGASRDVERPIYSETHRTVFEIVGESSYSLYMTHAILLALLSGVVSKALGMLTPSGLEIGFMGISILFAIIFSRTIEMPFRRQILRRFGKHRDTSVNEAAGTTSS